MIIKTEFVNPGETLDEYCNRTMLSHIDVKSFNSNTGEVEFISAESFDDSGTPTI